MLSLKKKDPIDSKGVDPIRFLESMKRYLPLLFLSLASFASAEETLEQETLLWEEGPSVLEYTLFLQEALTASDWWSAIDCAEVISKEFADSPFAIEAPYSIGEAYFHLGQFELANENFSKYLTNNSSPKHFEEAISYKFRIAEEFRHGAKKPLFGSHKLPKILSGDDDALLIYDDVIAAFPHHELAAQSLFGKALIQEKQQDFKPCLETLDLLIRRFPKHPLAIDAYAEKARVYLSQSEGKDLDPALLDLAELNLRKFRIAFPREEKITTVEKDLASMQEIFAENLMETGRFFQKTGKIPASILYYQKVISTYPLTEAAKKAEEKLALLVPNEKTTEEKNLDPASEAILEKEELPTETSLDASDIDP